MTGITTSNIAESRVAARAEQGDIFWPGDDRSNVSNRRKGQGGERTPWNAVCVGDGGGGVRRHRRTAKRIRLTSVEIVYRPWNFKMIFKIITGCAVQYGIYS